MKHRRLEQDDPAYQTRRRRRRIWMTMLGNVALHSLLLFVVVAAAWQLMQQVRLKEQEVATKQADVEQLQRQIAVMQSRNEALRYNVQYLKTDDGVEKVAREKLDLVRPGEVTFQVIAPPPPVHRVTAPPHPAPPPPQPWYRQFINAF